MKLLRTNIFKKVQFYFSTNKPKSFKLPFLLLMTKHLGSRYQVKRVSAETRHIDVIDHSDTPTYLRQILKKFISGQVCVLCGIKMEKEVALLTSLI